LPVREEMRRNLIAKIRGGEDVFPGIVGYDDTVVPQLENAILSGQDIILLGERGQAKSRIIRSLTSLLDEWTPVLDGCEIPQAPSPLPSPWPRSWSARPSPARPSSCWASAGRQSRASSAA